MKAMMTCTKMGNFLVFIFVLLTFHARANNETIIRIKLASSTVTAQLRGIANFPTAGETIQGVYHTGHKRHVFVITKTGPYQLWVGDSEGTNYTLDVNYGTGGNYAKWLMAGDVKNNISSIADSVITTSNFTKAALDFIGSGGNITNDPDDLSLETKPGSKIGIKEKYFVAEDSIELKTLTGDTARIVFLKEYSVNGGVGGGWFVLTDSVDGDPNHVTSFKSGSVGKMFTRTEYIKNSNRVYTHWGGVKGDFSGSVADTAGRNDASKILKVAPFGHTIIFDDGGKYYLGNSALLLNNKTLIGHNVTVYSGGNSDQGLIYAEGNKSASDTSSLTANAGIEDGQYLNKDTDKSNIIVVKDTSPFSSGDIIIISSDSTRSQITIGETARVDSIISSTKLTLHAALESFYTVDNNALIAKVNSVKLNFQGSWTLQYIGKDSDHFPTSGPHPGRGVSVRFGDSPNLTNIDVRDFPDRGFMIESCYAANLDVKCENSRRTGTGYGISITGASQFCTVKATVIGSRHAVHNGGNGDGLPGRNTFSGTYVGRATSGVAGGSQVFDSHGPVLSVFCKDAVLVYHGAANNLQEASGGGQAFLLGAYYNHIDGVTLYGFTDIISIRASDMSIYARNIKAYNSSSDNPGILSLGSNHKMNEISLVDIEAPGARVLNVAHENNFTIKSWHFDAIKCFGFGSLNLEDIDTVSIPKILKLTNMTFTGPNNFDLTDTDEYLPTGAFDTTGITLRNVSQIEKLIIDGCTFENYKNAVYFDNDTIPLLILKNNYFLNNYRHLYFSADTFNMVDINNNFFGDHCGINNNNNPILRIIDGPEIINNLYFNDNTIYSTTTRWLINVDASPSVNNLSVFGNKIHTGVSTIFWHPDTGATNVMTKPQGIIFNATNDSMRFIFPPGFRSVQGDTSEYIKIH